MSGTRLKAPAVWFPAIRAGTGIDVFTERLAAALQRRGFRAEITWLPHRTEYAPWLVRPPRVPDWANVAHCNSWFHPGLLPKQLPVVVTIHSCVHDPALAPYKSGAQTQYHRHWIRRLEKAMLVHASRITAVSDYTAARANEAFGLRDIEVIHNWIDSTTCSPIRRDAPADPMRLLFVGNLSVRKGMDLLPEIMRRLGPRFTLDYTGIQKDIGQQIVLPRNMRSLGRLDNPDGILYHYHTSDALLFPTRLEGLSLSALEAMACGLPIITSNSSSMPELVSDYENGFLCGVDNIDCFVRAAKLLKSAPDLWQRMSKAAIVKAQHFSEDEAIRRYITLYRQLLAC